MEYADIKIVVEIKNYVELHGGDYSDWYVGRAVNPRERLIEHGVNLDCDHYIYLSAARLEDAGGIEQYFVTRMGTDGNVIGYGDLNGIYVYAYEKSITTRP
jgi:hypothetical protein